MSDNSPRSGRLRERAAEEIRVILARRRMSAAELARRTGIRQQNLSRRMTGETAFDLDDLEVIARELGVTVAELLGPEGGSGAQTTVPKLRVPDRRPAGAERPTADRPTDTRSNGRPPKSGPKNTSRRPVLLRPTGQPR